MPFQGAIVGVVIKGEYRVGIGTAYQAKLAVPLANCSPSNCLAGPITNLLKCSPSRYAAELGSCNTVTGIPVDPEVVFMMQALVSVPLDVLNSSEFFLISSLVMMGSLFKLATSMISDGCTLFFLYN